MRPIVRPPAQRPLQLEGLEGRSTPAGDITASLAGGVLTLKGDELANQLQLRITRDSAPSTASTVLVTGLDGTTVDGQATASFLGVRSARVQFGDGNDLVSADPTGDLDLAGTLMFDLGGGDNTLSLLPGGRLSLGRLAVRAGDGADTVEVAGGAGPAAVVSGPVSLSLGDGPTSTSFTGVELPGGVGLAARDGEHLLTLDGVSAVRPSGAGAPVRVSTGPGLLDAALTGSELGAVSLTGLGDINLRVTDSATRSLGVTGGRFGFVDTGFDGATLVDGALTLRGYHARLNVFGGLLDVAGNVAVTGTVAAVLNNQAALSAARSLAVRAAGDAVVLAGGVSVTVGADMTVAASNAVDVTFSSSAPSELKGALAVRGGTAADTFTADANLRAARGLALALGAGADWVSLTGAGATPAVAGSLRLDTGSGADEVRLDRVSVAGPTLVRTGSGADLVGIQSDSTFTGPVTIDLGAGDDGLAVATAAGSAGPVTYSGKAIIRLGYGNDSAALGVAGAANSKVVFGTAGSLIHGGPGLNLFDDEAGQVDATGLVLTAVTDPTP